MMQQMNTIGKNYHVCLCKFLFNLFSKKIFVMKNLLSSLFLLLLLGNTSFSQTKQVELYDLLKKFIPDSSEYSSVGDWSVGNPSAFPVKWNENRIVMSDDMKINFYRTGIANITLNGKTYGKWTVMLRGPRAGFTNFNISSPNSTDIKAKQTIDNVLGKKDYTYTLLKSCDANPNSGYYYYQLKIAKKPTSWLKIAWTCKNGDCKMSLDCYDDGSKQYADLNCP